MDIGRKSFSPSSSDADLSQIELRSRRAWHTTPDTPHSSIMATPVSSSRKRKESQGSKSGTPSSATHSDAERSASSGRSREPSPVSEIQTVKTKKKRRKVYTYFTTEEPSLTPKNSTPYSGFRDGSAILFAPFYGTLVVVAFVALCLCLYWVRWASTDVTCQVSSRTLVDQLSTQFPNQPKRLWAQLRTALESRCSQQENVAAMERTPVVILLVHHKDQGVDRNHSDALFHSFVSCLGRLVVKLLPSPGTQNNENCLTVTPFIDEHGSILNSVISSKAEQLKWKIDTNLSSSYESGVRCFHVKAVDLLPADTVVLFHGVADSQNSLYKEATLLFSLAHVFEPDLIERPNDNAIGATHHRSFEHRVQRYLRSVWEQYLGNDEVNALLSRLTPNIGVFYTNPNNLASTPAC